MIKPGMTDSLSAPPRNADPPFPLPPPLRSFLHDVQLDDDTRTAVEDMCMTFHTDARHVGAEFLAQLGRHT